VRAESAPDQAATGNLKRLSVEDLMDVQVTSVSKQAEPVSSAAAAIYVITHQDVVRSGATSIPEILRLAPNLHVVELSPSSYTITARGFSGNAAAIADGSAARYQSRCPRSTTSMAICAVWRPLPRPCCRCSGAMK
jgi:outer membrane receptor for ferrienterochelin and colicin